ncbi:MAG: Fmu (Sun) domain-containing protein [Ginsengibacter sp.]
MNNDEPSFPKKGNHFHRYLEYASTLLNNYNGKEPFHLYLKKYFSTNKKHGSRDRKQITSLCYYYFRLGFGTTSAISVEEKLILATFLIEENPSSFLETLNPEWNKNINLAIDRKLELVKDIFDVKKIFPFREALSNEINFPGISLSFLIQAKLFIRIRPGYQNAVFDKIKSANISFEKINDHCLSFANNEKLTNILDIDKEAIIQDYNSQQTLSALAFSLQPSASGISVWDCCAASGGKSILACDLLKNIELTVSDTRQNILSNLDRRFEKAGIKNYQSFPADLSISTSGIGGKFFDLIIADVPCSGSGTWARTPEQLHYFKKEQISEYAALQKKIVTNIAKALKKDGYLLYITCSVFKEENEENVNYIQNELGLELLQSKYLKGYEMQADTLFVALFTFSKK